MPAVNRVLALLAVAALGAGAAAYVLVPALLPRETAAAPSLPRTDDDRLLLDLARRSLTKSGSPLYNILKIQNRYAGVWEKYGRRAHAPVVLEIGPGDNIAQGVAFAMRGAGKYYALDIYRAPSFFDAAPYEAVALLVSSVAPAMVRHKAEDVFSVEQGKVRFNRERIEYLYPHQSYDIPLPPGTLDFVFSNAVFEHILDPEATIRELRRVLKPGGITAHQIDMRNHDDFARPLEYLKLDAAAWKQRTGRNPAHEYENRWRLPQFRAVFEANGFQILHIEVTHRYPVTEEQRRALHPDFRNFALDDLSTVGALVIARRR